MYAKIFEQIFDSSIADNYEVRHIFQDLLILADRDGCVDMTASAISRRINVPLKKVEQAIQALSEPDEQSRSKGEDGRRLIPLDSRRSWGWIIVNYEQYRNIQDEESRRASWRDAKARQRQKQNQAKKPATNGWKKRGKVATNAGEAAYLRSVNAGATEEQLNNLITQSLPEGMQ